MIGSLPALPSGQGSTGGGVQTGGVRPPRRPRPAQPPGGAGTPPQGGTTPQQTFSQLQQQGMARPAPPPAASPQQVGGYAPSENQQGFQGQLQGAVSNALSTPSRYDLPQVQQVRDALTGQLEQQFGSQKKHIDEDLARRGLSASSIGAGYYGDLASNQANAMANMNAQLIQNQAASAAGDLSASLGAGQNFSNAMSNQGLAQYGANLQGAQANNQSQMAQQQFNQGQYDNASQLALGAGQAAGSLGLGQQSQNLQQMLGLGNLGLAQNAQGIQQQQFGQNLSEQQAGRAQQGQQFGQSLGEQGRQFDLQQQLQSQLGLGNLGVQQQQANTQQAGMLGQLGLDQAQLAQQGQQFGQSLGLQQQAQDLQAKVQNGQLTLQQAQQQLAELQNTQQYGLQRDAQGIQQQQFGQSLGEQQAGREQQGQQFTQSQGQQAGQFADQLKQQLGLATMSDKTSNRGIDANAALAQNDLYLKIAGLLQGMDYPKMSDKSAGNAAGSSVGGGGVVGGDGVTGANADGMKGVGGAASLMAGGSEQASRDAWAANNPGKAYLDFGGRASPMGIPASGGANPAAGGAAGPANADLQEQLRRMLSGLGGGAQMQRPQMQSAGSGALMGYR